MAYPEATIERIIGDLERENAELRQALKHIANPLKAIKDDADRRGYTINGQMAVQLSENANYLQGVARKALSRKEGES
jgi:hypothetical protein